MPDDGDAQRLLEDAASVLVGVRGESGAGARQPSTRSRSREKSPPPSRDSGDESSPGLDNAGNVTPDDEPFSYSSSAAVAADSTCADAAAL